ncbi:MAG: inorganic phosphate transporter [Candidatus Obscuribacterales bacterium]|nr:inorganic phosphate transporter [Candidatus Obscuribacterales bacterium]
MSTLAMVILVIGLSLLFTYTNGFQDGSSVAASAVASRAMTKLQAVFVCATFEFLGAMLGGSAVSSTIRNLTSWPDNPSLLPVLASGLFSAILWNYVTKIIKVPSSSTHALVGGILGALAAAGHGFQYVVWGELGGLIHPTGVYKVVISLFASPLIGFLAGYVFLKVTMLLLIRCSTAVNKPLKLMQFITVPVLAFAHGANDTQKAMGLMVLALGAAKYLPGTDIPIWVRIISGAAMATGIASLVPGIVKRVGGGIYRMRPVHGFVTELASAAVVLTGSMTGGPVSASQVIASTVMGIGTAERKRGVHWLIARDMLLAWFLTIPCAGLLAYLVHLWLFQYLELFLPQVQ